MRISGRCYAAWLRFTIARYGPGATISSPFYAAPRNERPKTIVN
jgi:hypothetical protein